MDKELHGSPGWVPTALDGLKLTLDIANEKRIKIVINGGAVNPKGLAEKTYEMVGYEKSPLIPVVYAYS